MEQTHTYTRPNRTSSMNSTYDCMRGTVERPTHANGHAHSDTTPLKGDAENDDVGRLKLPIIVLEQCTLADTYTAYSNQNGLCKATQYLPKCTEHFPRACMPRQETPKLIYSYAPVFGICIMSTCVGESCEVKSGGRPFWPFNYQPAHFAHVCRWPFVL